MFGMRLASALTSCTVKLIADALGPMPPNMIDSFRKEAASYGLEIELGMGSSDSPSETRDSTPRVSARAANHKSSPPSSMASSAHNSPRVRKPGEVQESDRLSLAALTPSRRVRRASSCRCL